MSDAPLPSLTIGGARLLSAHLSAAGWCTEDVLKAYRASALSKRLRRLTPKTMPIFRDPTRLTPQEGEELREWSDTVVPEIVLTEKERELSREAITYFAKAGKIELGDDLVATMDAIGMKPEAI